MEAGTANRRELQLTEPGAELLARKPKKAWMNSELDAGEDS